MELELECEFYVWLENNQMIWSQHPFENESAIDKFKYKTFEQQNNFMNIQNNN